MQDINLIVIGIYLFLAIFFFFWGLILKGRHGHLETREKLVCQRECNCERRAELLDAAENDLDHRCGLVERWIDDSVEMSASYLVTDSDELKYSSEQAIRNVARNRIAHNIAFDIIHRFEPNEEKNEFGRTKFSYHLKVLEDK